MWDVCAFGVFLHGLVQFSELTSFFFFFFFGFLSFRAVPVAYGGFQARGPTGAVAAGLRQSHSNVGSVPCL